jgi:hypothetical protein
MRLLPGSAGWDVTHADPVLLDGGVAVAVLDGRPRELKSSLSGHPSSGADVDGALTVAGDGTTVLRPRDPDSEPH